MTVVHMPGRNSRNTTRVDTARYPYPGCSGGCHQGDSPCDCANELANTIPPRSEFPTPDFTAADRQYQRMAWRRMVASALGAWVAFAFLLWIAATAARGG